MKTKPEDDLIGDTSKKAAAKAKAKPTKAKPAKEKEGKKAKAKPAKERGKRGDGNSDFPRSGSERILMRKLIAKKVKAKITLKEFAANNDLELWKVRLAVKDLAQDKQLKMSKSNGDGGLLVMSPR